MTNNKLIAEFMGWKSRTNEETNTQQFFLAQPDHWYLKDESELQYHTSWDWLMPVVDKIKILVMEDDSDELYNSEEWDNITHTLVQIEIKSVYQAVVEFIKQYNNGRK